MVELIYFVNIEKMRLPKILEKRMLPDIGVCVVADWDNNDDVDEIVSWYADMDNHDWYFDYTLEPYVMKELRGLMLEQRDWSTWWRLKLVQMIGWFKPIELIYRIEFSDEKEEDTTDEFNTVDISAVIKASRAQEN